MKGWVYVISTKSMQGLVKVGFSTKDPELRAKELNHTGSPHPYMVEYEMLIEDPYEIEQKTHHLLLKKLEKKEWFRCSAEEAIAAIKQVSGEGAISESYKRADRAKAEALHQQELKATENRRKREKDALELSRKREQDAIELTRKLEKEQKELDFKLRYNEMLICEKFDEQISASFPPRPFWFYILGGGLGSGVGGTLAIIGLVAIFNPPISWDQVWVFFVLSAFFGVIYASRLERYFESKRKQSSAYIALEKQRDEELAAAHLHSE